MTLEELRAKYPDESDEALRKALAIINAEPQPIEKIWASENVMPDVPLEAGPDGLTKPMRELNEFAEKHGMPIPFKSRPRAP